MSREWKKLAIELQKPNRDDGEKKLVREVENKDLSGRDDETRSMCCKNYPLGHKEIVANVIISSRSLFRSLSNSLSFSLYYSISISRSLSSPSFLSVSLEV
eukprot:sb/3478431/